MSKINVPGYGFPISVGVPATGAFVTFQDESAGFVAGFAQDCEVTAQWEISNIAVPGLLADPAG
nr:hypothetical protein [Ferrimicrobium acidiphilum]